MIFNSYLFFLMFLPVMVVIFYIPILRNFRAETLLISSIIFYGYSSTEHALVLILNILIVYWITSRPTYKYSKIMMIAAIFIPSISLVYYKYLGFIVHDIIYFASPPANSTEGFSLFDSILLPAGISFFTFQLISFAFDHYQRKDNTFPSLRHFSLYISFFPQLVAGPIVRFEQVSSQITALTDYHPTKKKIEKAIIYIVVGMSLKVIFADTLSQIIDPVVLSPSNASSTFAIYTLLAYSFQIYFDFYGYSLMAIGLGILFGIHLPMNFDRPYISRNPKEFWRRWHITLSFWIRDYLYIPLGGNQSYVRNILIIFVIAGIWHGAGWNFIVWGLAHGLLAASYHWGSKYWDLMPVALQRTGTFLIVSFAWLLFLFDSQDLQEFFRSLFSGFHQTELPNPTLTDWFMIALSGAAAFWLDINFWIEKPHYGRLKRIVNSTFLAILSAVAFMLIDMSDSFIYFRF